MRMASPCFLPLLFVAALISFCQLPANANANAKSPNALVAPITKDLSTLLYTIEILHRTPLEKQHLMLDLTSDYTWVRCYNQGYISSTYSPVGCSDRLCDSYAYSGCGTCYAPKAPGCNNDTCVVPGYYVSTSYELARDVAELRGTDGKNPGAVVRVPGLAFACADKNSAKLPPAAKGVAGMTASTLALPVQLCDIIGVKRQFAMCLPSGSKVPGVLFFGGGPYVFLPPPGRDLSKSLITTPLINNTFYTDDYYIGVKGVRVNGVHVPMDDSKLVFGYRGRGGTKLSTLVAYTELASPIYNSLVRVFDDVAKKMNMTKAAAVGPFGACFNSKGVGSTRVGPAVPSIDLVLQKNETYWRIFGGNSMVKVSDKVMCLGFVDGGEDPVTSIVIGTHQMEDNLLHFDLATSTLGFSSTLLFRQTTCSNFNFTSSK